MREDVTDDMFLGGTLNMLQPRRGYRAGTDPVLLAAACPATAGQSVLELGCGVGTALLCLGRRVPLTLTGLERIPDYAALAAENFARNGIAGQIYTGDLSHPPSELCDQTFDHVMINPPFFAAGQKAKDTGRAMGRQEDTPLEMWVDQALRRLKPKGYLTLIHLTERLSDVIALLNSRAGDIKIKPLSARTSHLPKRFILLARKGSSGPTTLYNALILHKGPRHTTDQDSFSGDAKSILRDGMRLSF